MSNMTKGSIWKHKTVSAKLVENWGTSVYRLKRRYKLNKNQRERVVYSLGKVNLTLMTIANHNLVNTILFSF